MAINAHRGGKKCSFRQFHARNGAIVLLESGPKFEIMGFILQKTAFL
jgi:hypothetical protein